MVDGWKIVGQGQKTGNGAEDRGKGGNGWLERNEDGRKEDEDTELSRQGQKRGGGSWEQGWRDRKGYTV